MHLWTNPAKPRQQEEQQKALPAAIRHSSGAHQAGPGSTGKGSRAALWCWATPRAALHSPHMGSRSLCHIPLSCPRYHFPGSTPLQTNAQPSQPQQGRCTRHLQLTADCPERSAQALNCEAAAAPPWGRPGNTPGVTRIALTPPAASHSQTKPGQAFYIHQCEGEGKTLKGLNNLSASLTDADIFDTR